MSWRHRDAWMRYSDVIISAMASQITRLTIVFSNVYSGADQRKHQSSAPLAFVWGIHRWPVNFPHKRPVARKMFPFDDVMTSKHLLTTALTTLSTSWSVGFTPRERTTVPSSVHGMRLLPSRSYRLKQSRSSETETHTRSYYENN